MFDNVSLAQEISFAHLPAPEVECCDTCHHFYPHYEMNLIDLPDGSKARAVALAIRSRGMLPRARETARTCPLVTWWAEW